MRIGVFGAGAVGGYVGARLAAAGEDVTFIARGAHLDAIRESGLRLDSPNGDLVLTADRFRDQAKNRKDCVDKLAEMLRTVEKPPRPRRPTKASGSPAS